MNNSWYELWNNRKKLKYKSLTLKKLLEADGICISESDWIKSVLFFGEKVNIERCNKIIEIGCGSGAFLYPFYLKGKEVSGIDYSKNQILIAQEAIPKGNFKVAEANRIPYDDSSFDAVFCNSVFQYFPDLNYTNNVMKEILRIVCDGKKCIITDILNEDKKTEFKTLRMKELNINEEQWNERYSKMRLLHYNKDWFETFAETNTCEFEIFEDGFFGYPHGKFRFNFVFWKRS